MLCTTMSNTMTTIRIHNQVSDDIDDIVVTTCTCTDAKCLEHHIDVHKRIRPTDVFRYHIDDNDDVVCTYDTCTKEHVDELTAGVHAFCRMLETPLGRFTHDTRAPDLVHDEVTGKNRLQTASLIYNHKCWHCNPTRPTKRPYKAYDNVNPNVVHKNLLHMSSIAKVSSSVNQPPKKRAVTLDERKHVFMHTFQVNMLSIEKIRWFTRLMKEFQTGLGYDITETADVRKFFFTEDPKELYAMYRTRMNEEVHEATIVKKTIVKTTTKKIIVKTTNKRV